jgi:hypothetical protein
MADAEGVIAELKNHHGLDRLRRRGKPTFHVQLLLGCAAINLKRLAKHAGPASEGVAAAPAAAAAALSSRSHQRQRTTRQRAIGLSRQQLVWTVSLCLN